METASKKNVTALMIVTIFSKILGFLRDIVFANYYGTSLEADAFYVSQTIPEFLFAVVVQAISIGFIPIFIEIENERGKEEANHFTNNILKICLILTFLLISFVNIFSREIVSIFAHGFTGEKAALTAQFTRIVVFSMFFRIIVAVYSAFLNARGRFIKPALNGIILDVVMIGAIVISFYTKSVVLAFGLIVATFIQFFLLFVSVRKEKKWMGVSLRGLINDDTRKMISLLLPVILGVGASQINVLADKTMASSIPGAISSLNYANKVNNVLENIIILSLATVIFPSFSKMVSRGDKEGLKDGINQSVSLASITMIPCCFISFAFAEIIISLLFGRGVFDASSIGASSVAMKFYSIGLVFLSYNAILIRAFYAMKKAKTVSLISCVAVVVNIIFNFLLKPSMGIGGLALATSISNIVETFLLMIYMSKNVGPMVRGIFPEAVKSLVSSSVMIGVMLLLYSYINTVSVFFSFTIAAIVGIIVFIGIEFLLKSKLITLIFPGDKENIGEE